VADPPPKKRRGEWAPHFWIGCDAFALACLLARHRFAVHPSKWYVVAAAAAVAPVHTALRLVQSALYGSEIRRTRITHAPVFIIGHWRSGTTLLHELLIRDPRHASPTTYDCLVPHHSLLTGTVGPRLLWWMLPRRRPMDNMPAGWDRPQEDEFALCLLGQPSPYERIAFPNGPYATADFDRLTPPKQRSWKTTFLEFMRRVTIASGGRRLILKSPPHTWRIETLLELFPDARFVHIVRDPYVIYPSTMNLWRSLYAKQGLQRPPFPELSEFVLNEFVAMHARLEQSRRLISKDRFHELRYEDFLRDPANHLETIYRDLDLGDFEPARQPVEAYLSATKNYETNRYELASAERKLIAERWGHVIRRYGYEPSESEA
jgi:hypothetical protein